MRDSQQSPLSSVDAPVVDPQTRCHLFRLPRELRDLVYDYTFAKIRRDPIPVTKDPFSTPKLDLALTCCRICHEALQPYHVGCTGFFADNTFCIPEAYTYRLPCAIKRRIRDIHHLTIPLSDLEPQLVLDLTTKSQSELWNLTWSTGSTAVTRDLSSLIEADVTAVIERRHRYHRNLICLFSKDTSWKHKHLAIILWNVEMRRL